MKRGIEHLDMLFILRPMLLYPVWTFFMAGVWRGRLGGEAESWYVTAGVFVCLTCVAGALFILNQICDKETDRINNKLFLISEGIVSDRAAYMEAGVLAAAGLGLSLVLSFRLFMLMAGMLLVSGWGYNYRPFKWKDRPLMGMVTNSVSGLLIFSAGWVTGGGESMIPLSVIPYAIAGAAVYLDTTLPDMEGDRQAGKITFAVRYGIKPCVRLAALLEFAAVASAFLLHDRLVFYAGIVVLPLFIVSAVKPTLSNAVRAIKFSVVSLLAAVCIMFPFMFAAVLFLVAVTKWYYKKRFNFDYPTLKSSNE